MTHVVVVGCGVVGAAIAYDLSQRPDLTITVVDKHLPAQESTGAALGVLMGAISQKKKGRAWAMRNASIRRYESLIPELEAKTGLTIPYNRDGIVLLRFEGDEDEEKWHTLAELRRSQGWRLDVWSLEDLRSHCPSVGTRLGDRPIVGAVHSVDDRQVDPVALTHALVTAATLNGVDFQFNTEIRQIAVGESGRSPYRLWACSDQHPSEQGIDPADWVVLCTGLGTFPLTQAMADSIHPLNMPSIDIRPVAGQAVRIALPSPIEDEGFSPVISGNDIHIVPLGHGEYWVGATVEFPQDDSVPGHRSVPINEKLLAEVRHGAADLFPPLTRGTVVNQWFGLRPRPWNRAAPIIEPLDCHPQIILATGHYRNGVLLAPATAQQVCAMIT